MEDNRILERDSESEEIESFKEKNGWMNEAGTVLSAFTNMVCVMMIKGSTTSCTWASCQQGVAGSRFPTRDPSVRHDASSFISWRWFRWFYNFVNRAARTHILHRCWQPQECTAELKWNWVVEFTIIHIAALIRRQSTTQTTYLCILVDIHQICKFCINKIRQQKDIQSVVSVWAGEIGWGGRTSRVCYQISGGLILQTSSSASFGFSTSITSREFRMWSYFVTSCHRVTRSYTVVLTETSLRDRQHYGCLSRFYVARV
jgi:hypothetical protein